MTITLNELKDAIGDAVRDIVNRGDLSMAKKPVYKKFKPEMQDWADSVEDGEPTVNCPILMMTEDQLYYAWKRASDGKYEIRGYYEEEAITPDFPFKWMYFWK